MLFRMVLGIILLIISCKEPPAMPTEEEIPIILDSDPPIIKWISPHFDAVVSEVSPIICQVTDKSGIDLVQLWSDSSQASIINMSVSDSIYTFNWLTSNYNNGDKPLLFIKSVDLEGNDTISQNIRIIIDNYQAYPEPVSLYPLDSLFADSVFSGYEVRWWNSGDQFFSKYILQKSSDPLMIENTEIFSTDNKSTIEYDDYGYFEENIMYYRIIVEDIFGKQTAGNVVSTSMIPMPLQWNIKSIKYTTNTLTVEWSNPEFERYNSHQLLYSDQRDGTFEILAEYQDSLINQYEDQYFPASENWFSILTEDSLGQKSISEPKIHPPPQIPSIDSVLYNDNSFRLQWAIEPDIDFVNYQILSTEDENAFNLSEIQLISNQTENILNYSVNESQYYLFQIITTDAWNLETRSPVIMASSFNKFSITKDNGSMDILYSVLTNKQGEYIAVGESSQSSSWYLNINKDGDVEVSNNLGDLNSVYNSIVEVSGENYFVTGAMIGNQDKNLLVKKIDGTGAVIWSNDYDLEYPDAGNAIINLNDGNLGVTGFSHVNTVNQDILAMKINVSDGSEIWSTYIGGNERDEGHDILPANNGGMYILGETHSEGDGDGDIWILELDADGKILDTLLINIPGKQIGYSFIRSENGTFTIAGETSGSSGVRDALIIQIDEYGDVIWIYRCGGAYNDAGYSLVYSNGGWVLAGQTYSYDIGGGDAWLVKVSESGNFVWMKMYGDVNNDIAYDIDIANDGGFIICGSTFIQGNQYDGWLIKTDSRGNYEEKSLFP